MAKYDVNIDGVGQFTIEVPDGSPPPTKEQVWAAYQTQLAGKASAPQEKPVSLRQLAGAAMQGLTFGFGDELSAAAGAAAGMANPFKPGSPFDYFKYRDQLRADQKAFEKDHPVAALGANIVGSLPTMLIPGLNMARGAKLTETAGRAVVSGVATGALAGAGAAEGGPVERGIGALKGAGAGFLVGGTIPTATRVGKAVAQRTADAFADSALGQWIGKLPGVQPPGGNRGVEKVAQALQKDGLSPLQAAMRADELAVGGKPAVMADAGRTSTLRLGRDVINAGPAGTADVVEQLATRADEAGSRITNDLVATTGLRGDAQQVATALMQQRAAAAAPLYARAYTAGARPVNDPIILGMLRLPEFQQAVRAGYKLAAVEGVNIPAVRDTQGRTVRVPTLQVLDYVKRGLDDILYSGKRTGTIGRGMLRALETRRQEFLSRLDQLYPDYAKARAVYAGDTRMLEAVEAGREFARMAPVDIRAELAQLSSPAEREHFLIGAVDSLKQAIGNSPDGSDVVRRVFGVREKRQILESLFPSKEAFRDFANRLTAEKRMRMTLDATRGNSTTAQQSVGLADLADDEMLSMIPQLATGNYMGVAGRLMNRSRGNLGANAEAALPILFGDPRNALEKLVRARQMLQRQADQPIRSAAPAGTVSGLLTGR